ncbi:uncharacterized protein PHALS_14880 [Plasmopara halstedii]|uniref:Uncharacterized protein n=1 Tax=Plasmopara halstedii TaxID=4781 RepID=A0A0P1AWG8_PLAHL|nr:uncharacterized protein PHALS_14880 [Plasmopara halstedii]CEG46158.1 hypothetical protein PHALS_14880 [Plasmopara halstedii]|eukprot:XP_024582527.1 hypothetical protein PHALS_14880 [Plasmopara halstedii]
MLEDLSIEVNSDDCESETAVIDFPPEGKRHALAMLSNTALRHGKMTTWGHGRIKLMLYHRIQWDRKY